jgi:hypothetical protein
VTEPNPHNQIDFGKHKGVRWRDISRSYLRCLIDAKTPIYAERAKSELSRRKKAKQAQRPGGAGDFDCSSWEGMRGRQTSPKPAPKTGKRGTKADEFEYVPSKAEIKPPRVTPRDGFSTGLTPPIVYKGPNFRPK